MNEKNDIIIDIESLYKVYATGELKVPALKNINFTVEKGDYIAVMGPSGSGKSTLMNILGCLDQPTSGVYKFNGINVESLDDMALSRIRNQNIGFVFQNFNLLPRMNARENVELPLVYRGVHARERKKQALEMLEKVGLTDRVDHKPNELSGGQKQRTAIARALINRPSIILADEPTGNLDTKTGYEIMRIFNKINEEGNTIIMVTHELELSRCASRTIELRDGMIR